MGIIQVRSLPAENEKNTNSLFSDYTLERFKGMIGMKVLNDIWA
jgi:hypothetical protein